MSGGKILLMPPNGHPSASQRKIAVLEAAQAHLIQVIAVLVAQGGGLAIVPKSSLDHEYELTYKADPVAGDVLYTSRVKDAPALVDPEGRPA